MRNVIGRFSVVLVLAASSACSIGGALAGASAGVMGAKAASGSSGQPNVYTPESDHKNAGSALSAEDAARIDSGSR